MTAWLLIQLVALLALLLLSGFFSSSEVALFSLNPLHIRRIGKSHPAEADRIRRLVNEPNSFLSTILIGNTLVNVVISVLGFALFTRLFPRHGEWLAMAAMTLLLLLFGEVMPKRAAFRWPVQIARWYAPPLVLLIGALTPLRLGLEWITDRFHGAFQPRGRTLSEDEFESVVAWSEEEGVLHEEERDMLLSILRLEDLQARDVMTPRVDLIGAELNSDTLRLEQIARAAKVRYLVLYREHLDQMAGFLDIRGFLLDPAHRLQPAWSPPIYVPESAPLDRLLEQFLRERRRVAIVVDEYGGTAGLITRGDILEEITGDLDDEQAAHKRLFEPVGPNRWLLDGQISLEEINQKLDAELEADGVDRLAGWIAARLERLPRAGDRVRHQGVEAVVQQMRHHRVTQVLLEQIEPPAEEQP